MAIDMWSWSWREREREKRERETERKRENEREGEDLRRSEAGGERHVPVVRSSLFWLLQVHLYEGAI